MYLPRLARPQTERKSLTTMNTRTLTVAAALSVAFVSPIQPNRAAAQSDAFSRSEWIARNADRVRFSGGVLPDGARLPRPASVALPTRRLAFPGDVTAPVRLSSDLLASDGESQAETQAEPYLAASPGDPRNVLAGWQESRYANGGARALGYAASTDEGATWNEGLASGLTRASGGAWDRASDPWVAFGPGSRAYFCSLLFDENSPDNAIGVNRSTDGGRTWGPVVIAAFSNAEFNDKQSLTVDTSEGSPFLGRVYVVWDANFDTNMDGGIDRQTVLVTHSSDEGSTWSRPVKVRKKGANVGCIARVGPDGSVSMVWLGGSLTGRKSYIYFAKSTDGGETWSKARRISEVRAAGVSGFRSGNGLPSFDVDPATGALHVAWSDARFTGVDQIALISSTDGGVTWSAPRRVSDGPGDAPAFTVSVAARPGGHVAVSSYSLRNDPERAFLVDLFVQVSADGGATFGAARRATPESFDIRWAAQARGYFLGDYIGLAGSSERFHLLWIGTPEPSAIDPERRQPDAFAASTP